MTRLAGPVRQIGVVVRDIDAAIRHWSDVIGIGPFLVFPGLVFDDYRYRGQPAEAPLTTIAIAFSGGLQVELIQQHNQAASAYRDFLEAGHEGMQHVSPWFDSAQGYDAAYQRLREDGLCCIHEGRLGEVRFAYFAGADGAAPHLEISEAGKPGTAASNAALQHLARHWDGASPTADASAITALLQGTET